MSRIDSSQNGFKGYGEWVPNFNRITQHQVGLGRGTEDCATCLHQGNIGIGVLQEMKIPGKFHTQLSLGYRVWATEVKSWHWGGIDIAWREDGGWEVEGSRSFGLNKISFIVTSGQKCWYVVRAYVPPNNIHAVHQITHALEYGPERVGKLLVGDRNACLEHLRDQWEEHLYTVIVSHGMTDQSHNFMPRRRYRAEVNWSRRM